MAVNKVVYDQETIIDLTSDTVTEDTLFTGIQAHKADGTIIFGTFLEGYPDSFTVYDAIQDSDGNDILDSDNDSIISKIVYKKA